MKKSEKYLRRARNGAIMAISTILGTLVTGTWSVVEMMGDGSHAGGLALPMFVLSITGLYFSCMIISDALRDYALHKSERRVEIRKATRPRIYDNHWKPIG